MIVIKDSKTFCFNFDWPKDVDENVKHEIGLIIKSNESSADNKMKNEIEQLLLKCKHGNMETCCSSKFIYLLQVEKHKKTV